MKRFYIFFIISLFVITQCWGNNWSYHLSKVRTYDVVRGNKRIYFLSEGGIFYFDQQDNSVNTYTKIEGLSGSDFSGIEYSHATNSLVVFYQNSMVDVVPDNGIPIPIFDIKRKNISGNKTIYNATCYNDLCYLSCGFGIVVLDLVKLEIKDSFIIGQDGNYELVFDVAIDNENIYAGTPTGIKYAPLDSPNLLDYNYWNYVDHKVIEEYNYQLLEQGANRVWGVYYDEEWSVDRIVSRHNAETWYYENTEFKEVYDLNIQSNMVVYSGRLLGKERESAVMIYQTNAGLIHDIRKYELNDYEQTPFGTDTIPIDPRSAIIDLEGTVWIADMNYGAIRYRNGVFDIINPGGPIDNGAFKMNFSHNKLWVAKGGHDKAWDNLYEPAVFQSYLYSESKWESFTKFSTPVLEDYRDVIEVLPSPGDPNHIYVATWGGGILEFENGQYITSYNETNSSLQNISPGNYYSRIGGMDFDSQGNLWVSNSEVENVLHMKTPGGTWKAYSIPELAYEYKIGDLTVTENDDVWMIVPREKTNGLYVMSSDGKNRKHLDVVREFRNADEQVLLEMNDVYALVEDNEGEIWVGTSKGVAVYSNPEQVFERDPFYASQPALDQDDGIYHPLLRNETVTAIAVDGGNRKYFGTKGSGIYLTSADGTQEIEHYTAELTDLISDRIISLEYDGINGILYVGTDIGLVALQTESKKAFEHFTDVYAYPNPVRSGYEGDIYITGLVEDTNVKITTVSGQLVYETTSIGGQATWSGHDLAGNKVHTGIYLVFCASQDGQESVVTKILFIRPS